MRHLFLRLAITLITVGLLAPVNSGCSRKSKIASHLARADRYFDSGEYDNAEIEYKNVLQLERLQPHAISHLGLIYFDQGRLGRAFPFLQKAIELQPEDNLDVRHRLGAFYLATGKINEARDSANFILDHKPEHAEAPVLLAESALQSKDIEEARGRLHQLPKPASDRAPVLVALAVLDLRQRKFKETEAFLMRALAADPKFGAAHSILAALYRTRNDFVRAGKSFADAAALSPPRSPRRLQYAQFSLQQGEIDTGKRVLEEIGRIAPDYLPAWILRAEVAAAERNYDASVGMLEKVLARDASHPEALLLMARVRLAKGEKEKALVAVESAAKLYPQSPQVHYQLGLTYVANNEVGKATTSLTRAVSLAPGFSPAILALADLNIRQGNLVSATISLQQFLQQEPKSAEARLLLASAYRAAGKLDDALSAYRELEKLSPNNPQTALLTGLVLLQQKNKKEARAILSKALEVSPDFLPALEQLINIDLADKQFEIALRRLDAPLAKNPKVATPYLILAKIYSAQSDTAKAETAMLKAIEQQPDSPIAYFLLARMYISSGQYQKALSNIQQAIARNPKDVQSLMMLGVLQDQQKNYTAARGTYEKILSINPKFSPALNNLAYLYSEHFGEYDKAHEAAQKARELLPQEPHTADTLGWILYKKRQYAWALSLLQESSAKLPEIAEVQYHLGMTHYMMGEEEPARAALERAIALSKDFMGINEAKNALSMMAIIPARADASVRGRLEKAAEAQSDPIVLAKLGALYEHGGAVNKASDAYEAALKASPNNIGVAISLIRVYQSRKENAKAFDLAKATRKLAPDDPTVAYALGRLAYSFGDFSWAVSLLHETARKQPDEPEVLYDFARASYAVGQVPPAETAIQHALRINPRFSRANEARQFLQMLALARDAAAALSALSTIEAILKSDPADVSALMALGAASIKRRDGSAAKLHYEKILAHYPDFTPAKRQLAILYAESPGNDQKAVELATKAREIFPQDPELAKALGILLFRQGNYPRAVTLLNESARHITADPVLIYYLGMTQYHLKRQAESKRALQEALDLNLNPELSRNARAVLAEMK